MRLGVATVCLLGLVSLMPSGCVEKKILIRTNPPGAPAWVDEKPVGVTPVDYRFEYYGRRRIRVGPIRSKDDKATYVMTEREVEFVPPWFERFPTDFFCELIWPWTIADDRLVEFNLRSAAEHPTPTGAERAQEVLGEGEAFRKKALEAVPEAE